jgi:hypothetical protein
MERGSSSGQRERLLDGTARLYEGNRRLQDSHAIALETGTFYPNTITARKSGSRDSREPAFAARTNPAYSWRCKLPI